jgi:hypothetical protein
MGSIALQVAPQSSTLSALSRTARRAALACQTRGLNCIDALQTVELNTRSLQHITTRVEAFIELPWKFAFRLYSRHLWSGNI